MCPVLILIIITTRLGSYMVNMNNKRSCKSHAKLTPINNINNHVNLVQTEIPLTKLTIHLTERRVGVLRSMKKSTYNIKVRGVCGPWVSPDPRRAARLHVDDGGTQAVDVCLGVVPPTQDQLWTHVHLHDRT